MGRAIVRQPSAFLMDEPLSNLDAKLRVQMRAEIARLQRDLGVTTIYVTHDQVEAMTMGDRVVVLKDGYLQQLDTPQNLYESPTNVFVAAFIGSPSMNLYEAPLELDGQARRWCSATSDWPSPAETLERRPGLRGYDGRRVVVGIRPEDFEDAAVVRGAPADRRIKATVRLVEALGSELMVHFGVDAKRSTPVTPTPPRSSTPTPSPTPSPVSTRGHVCASTRHRDQRRDREPALLRRRGPTRRSGLRSPGAVSP